MEIYNLKYEELKKIILSSKKNHYGITNRIIPVANGAIKINLNLVKKICNEQTKENDFMEFFQNNGTYFLPVEKIDTKQISYLESISNNIKLTKMPKGIVRVNDLDIATLLNYHEGYHWLSYLEDITFEEYYHLVFNLLEEIRELENNDLYHINLDTRHVIYNEIKPQIVSIDGKNLKYNVHNYQQKEEYRMNMYRRFTSIFLELINRTVDVDFRKEFSYEEIMNVNYEKAKALVKKIERKL